MKENERNKAIKMKVNLFSLFWMWKISSVVEELHQVDERVC